MELPRRRDRTLRLLLSVSLTCVLRGQIDFDLDDDDDDDDFDFVNDFDDEDKFGPQDEDFDDHEAFEHEEYSVRASRLFGNSAASGIRNLRADQQPRSA